LFLLNVKNFLITLFAILASIRRAAAFFLLLPAGDKNKFSHQTNTLDRKPYKSDNVSINTHKDEVKTVLVPGTDPASVKQLGDGVTQEFLGSLKPLKLTARASKVSLTAP